MPAVQVQRVLDCLRDVHEALAEHCRGLSEAAGEEKLKLLFADVASREERFATAVDEFERTAGKDILTTWLQFVPDDVMSIVQAATDGPPAASLDEAIEQLQQVNRALADAYRHVARETECGHLCELFRNLVELEENNDRHLSKVMLGE
jgi:hypothetical protein